MKKIGACFAAVTAVLTIVSLIVYAVNVGGAGYFHNASISNLVLFSVLAVLALVVAIVLANVKVQGTVDTVVSLVIGAMQIVAPVLLAVCLINLIAGRAEGLGFIYFSNADVILEVQTAENMASATGTIANMVVLGISTVLGVIASFINIKESV